MEEEGVFVPITVDVEAVKSAAYEEGYRKGLQEGHARGVDEGYRERALDLAERLRAKFPNGEHQPCIDELERMFV